ncbi:hypothetical protein [Streptomyces sp. DH24]|uniref:hypothetical protein n=1 Tax=Streptomyces sp. DH24 TaxID=3040123 RepID=UPI002442FAFC|nr:hypothetical protein [Streptomyces sp. DH24]MDG9715457.1 hypothetical protein [Streptomyces sp. DH24]
MSRHHRPAPAPERHLMTHLRSTVWGPAEFMGLPPRRQVAKGFLVGCVGAGLIVGSTVAGAWYGVPGLSDGEGGLVCAAALALHLCLVRAGRALIGVVVVLAVCLALETPQAAESLVLAVRGRVQPVVVTSVEGGPGAVSGRGRRSCSVADRDGTPLKPRVWLGCGPATRPGDALAVVYDTAGRVPPRGLDVRASRPAPLRDLCGWAAALVTGCVIAVVRSFRLSHTTGHAATR